MLLNFLSLAIARKGLISDLSAVTVTLVSACLRFAHLQRCRVEHAFKNALDLVCVEGKRTVKGSRPSFECPVPLPWVEGDLDTVAATVVELFTGTLQAAERAPKRSAILEGRALYVHHI